MCAWRSGPEAATRRPPLPDADQPGPAHVPGRMASVCRDKRDSVAPGDLFLPPPCLSIFHFNYIYLVLFHRRNNISSQFTRHLSFFCARTPSPASSHYVLGVRFVDGVIYVKAHDD